MLNDNQFPITSSGFHARIRAARRKRSYPRSILSRFVFRVLSGTIIILSSQLTSAPPENDPAFTASQLKHPRVATARNEKDTALRRQFRRAGLAYPPKRLFLRIFKQEREFDVWVGNGSSYALFHTYTTCATSGVLGPKRREGDLQIPEGAYIVTHFNPYSSLYLSLGINYPNASDKKFADRIRPGGSIYIHGGCASIGCVSVTNDEIKEIYWLAVLARSQGQLAIPVSIFPVRMDEKKYSDLRRQYAEQPDVLLFWKSLKPLYDYFEKHHSVPAFSIDKTGYYTLTQSTPGP